MSLPCWQNGGMQSQSVTDSRRAFLSRLATLPLVTAAVVMTQTTQALPPVQRILMNDFAIAGFQYYDGPTALPGLTVGTMLTLRAEPGNPHDCYAVEILHGATKLGYVPRFCNRHLSRLLEGFVPLTCVVERVNRAAPPWETVFVLVSLPVA